MEILGSIKTYDWGKVGSKSIVAQLALKNDESFAKDFNESTPYAEIWYVLQKHLNVEKSLKNQFIFYHKLGWEIM